MPQNAVSDLGLDCLLLNTGISIKHGYNKKFTGHLSVENGPVQRVKVEESIQCKWVKSSEFTICLPLNLAFSQALTKIYTLKLNLTSQNLHPKHDPDLTQKLNPN